jgi:CheY-like chemotaxis protein
MARIDYSPTPSLDGEDGLRVARENIPDLSLLDMMLPKVSGLDVLRALKIDVLVKRIPVILLSGLGQANDAKLLKEDAAAFLMKSEKAWEDNSAVLIEAIERALTGTTARISRPDEGQWCRLVG